MCLYYLLILFDIISLWYLFDIIKMILFITIILNFLSGSETGQKNYCWRIPRFLTNGKSILRRSQPWNSSIFLSPLFYPRMLVAVRYFQRGSCCNYEYGNRQNEWPSKFWKTSRASSGKYVECKSCVWLTRLINGTKRHDRCCKLDQREKFEMERRYS